MEGGGADNEVEGECSGRRGTPCGIMYRQIQTEHLSPAGLISHFGNCAVRRVMWRRSSTDITAGVSTDVVLFQPLHQ